MIDATGKAEKTAVGETEVGERSGCPFHKTAGKLTNEEVVGHARVVLLAGYETTANTLAYASYLLALNPDIQEKLQSEIDSYFDDKPVSQLISYPLLNTFHQFVHVYRMHLLMKQAKRLHT